MNKHEQARKKRERFNGENIFIGLGEFFDNYINEGETTEKELQDLKRDVKRYYQLTYAWRTLSREEENELMMLGEKLSKLGEEK